MQKGKLVFETVLEPVSGKAVPVMQGQTLRLSQVEGGQCVDFNAFNLHNYKEHLSVGHSRFAGFQLGQGATLVGVPPRIRPMLHLAEMPPTSIGDTLGPRCNAALFERRLGFERHTNCQDTLAESIREYGLTPEDVHDSFNMFGNTHWSEDGRYWWEWSTARASDSIDLLACMDLLCVPVTCGSGDVTPVSNFYLKRIKVEVFDATDEARGVVDRVNLEYAAPKTARRLDAEGWMPIRVERELSPDPGYRPAFKSPLKTTEISVRIPEVAERLVERVTKRSDVEDREDALRRLVMSWCISHLSSGDAGDSTGAAIAGRALETLIS